MKIVMIFAVFLLYICFAPSILLAQWVRTNGPIGGSVFCLTVSYNQTGTPILLAGNESGGFNITTDYGESWWRTSDGLTYEAGVRAVVVPQTTSETSVGSLIAASDSGVFLSTDNGTSWSPINNGLTNFNIRALALCPNAEAPETGENLYAGTWGDGIFLTTNNGANWNRVTTGLPFMNINALMAYPDGAGNTNLIAGAYGGTLVSTDNGGHWRLANTGITNPSVVSLANIPAMGGSTTLFAGTYGGGIFKSTDDGANWLAVNTGLTNKFVMALLANPIGVRSTGTQPETYLFAGTYGGGVFVSTNSGEAWTPFNDGLINTNVFSLALVPDEKGGTYLFAGTEGTETPWVWRYPLGSVFSKSWNLVSSPDDIFIHKTTDIFPSAVSEAFAYNGTYVSQESLIVGRGYWLKFDRTQYVTIPEGYYVTRYIDVVPGWNLIGSMGFPIPVANIGSDQPEMTTSSFFGYDGGYYETDTLQPAKGYWVKANMAGKLILSSIPLMTKTQRLRIIPTSEQPPPPPDELQAVPPVVPSYFALKQNYPNPFNPTTLIGYDVPENAVVTLKLYNLLGQELRTLVNENKTPGSYHVEFNANDLPSGVYFYKMTAGSFSEQRKMMVIR